MNGTWIETLVTPWTASPHPNDSVGEITPRGAAALLLEVRVADYTRYAEENPHLPEPSSATPPSSADEAVMPHAILRLLEADPTSADAFAHVVENSGNPEDLRVAALVLRTSALAKVNPITALDDLDSYGELGTYPATRALLLLQQTLRCYQIGLVERSQALNDQAREQIQQLDSGDVRSILQEVAIRNDWNLNPFGKRSNETIRQLLRRPAPSATLTTTIAVASGLGNYLREQFQAAVRDPYRPGTRWSAEDRAWASLTRSWLHAEIIGDGGSRRGSLQRLAYYHFLCSEPSQAITAYDTDRLDDRSTSIRHLFTADKSKELSDVLGHTIQHGPLASIVQSSEELLQRPLMMGELQARLALVREAADVLTDDTSTRESRRLRSLLSDGLSEVVGDDTSRQQLGWRPPYELVRTLAALAGRSSPDWHVKTGRCLLEYVSRQDAGPLVARALTRAVQQLRWSELQDSERQSWRGWAEGALQVPDLVPAAATTLAQLADHGDEAAANHILAHFADKHSLLVGAVMMSHDALRSVAVDQVATLTQARIEQAQKEATAGKHSFGVVDPALLLLAALLELGDQTHGGWNTLASFLLDPVVMLSQKETTLWRLAGSVEKLPDEVAARLRHSPLAVDEGPAMASHERETGAAALTALRLALGGGGVEDPLQAVLALLDSGSTTGRLAGVRTFRYVRPVVEESTLLGMALVLTRDSDRRIRAEAGWFVASSMGRVPAGLQAPVEAAVVRLLSADGTLTPKMILWGLDARDQEGDGLPLPSGVEQRVMALNTRHPAWSVRDLSKRVLAGRE